MKSRHFRTKSKQWQELRSAIATAIADHKISADDFRALSVYENHSEIEEKIYQTFCAITHPVIRPRWLWEKFRQERYALSNLEKNPEQYLDKLIEEQEVVWFMLNDTINEQDKFWIYEGRIKTIQKVIAEICFDELYLISKKYAWLICINHHDVLVATGKEMAEKLETLSRQGIIR